MLLTVYPPSVDGTANTPVVEDDTAVLDDAPPPSDAVPFDTVYVQVMPLTVAVSANDENTVAVVLTSNRPAIQ